MAKMELLGALEAEISTKQKCKQYCGTPCMILFHNIILLNALEEFKGIMINMNFSFQILVECLFL